MHSGAAFAAHNLSGVKASGAGNAPEIWYDTLQKGGFAVNIKKPSPDTMKEQAVRQAKDLLITVLILTAATGIGNIFWYFSFTRNIISVYILGTLLTSLFTKSYFYGF